MKKYLTAKAAAVTGSLVLLGTSTAAWWYPDSLVCSAFPVFCNR